MFSGSYFLVRMYDRATGKTTTLDLSSRVIVQSVNVTMKLGGNTAIEAQMMIPYDDRGTSLFESTLFNVSNVIMVKLGYSETGWSTPWIAGITMIPSATLDGEGISITVSGQGAGALALARSSNKVWKGTLGDVVEGIASRIGVDVEWERYSPTTAYMEAWQADPVWAGAVLKTWVSVPMPVDAWSKRYEWAEEVQAGESYFVFLRGILAKRGFTFWIGTGGNGRQTLFIENLTGGKAQKPKRLFVKFGVPDVTKNQYPLLTFSCSNKIFQADGAVNLNCAWMDDGGNIVEYNASEKESLATVGDGDGSATAQQKDHVHAESGTKVESAVQPDESGGTLPVAPGGGGGDKVEEQIQAQHDAQMAITKEATGSTMGLPSLLPGELIEITGCTKWYDGLYTVMEVRHSISATGFTTEFDMTRAMLMSDVASYATERPENPAK